MSGSYDDPVGLRIAWDGQTSGLTPDAWLGIWYKTSDFVLHDITHSEAVELNDEDETIAISLSSGTYTYNVVLVSQVGLWDLKGYFIVSDSGGTWQEVETSVDTTDGLTGTWVSVDLTPDGAYSDASVNPEFRDGSVAITANGVKAIRFRKLITVSNAGNDLYALHLYGNPSPTTAQDCFSFWSAVANTPLEHALLDFGTVNRSSSADVRFRINNHSTTAGENIVITSEALTDDGTYPNSGQFLFSADGGTTFAATVTIPYISPSGISSVIIARRVQHVNSAAGLWCGRFKASSTSTDGPQYAGYAYWYFGDTVTTGAPTPHIWHVTPNHGVEGDEFTLYGTGMGTSAADLTGYVTYNGFTGIGVVSWTRVTGTANATNGSRTITSTSADPEHNELVLTVPPPAGFSTLSLEVNTDA